MTQIRLARGLLEMGPEETRGVEWDWAPPDDNSVPGMGYGASDEAILWAKIGREYFWLQAIKKILNPPKKKGRKKLSPRFNINCRRALICYWKVHFASDREANSWTNRELLAWATTDKRVSRLFRSVENTLETSLSKGKSELGINDNWESPVCEKFWQH